MPGDADRFKLRSTMPVPPRELFAWHARPGAFERLMPPWETLSISKRQLGDQGGVPGPIGTDALLEMRLHKGPLKLPWLASHHGYEDHGEDGGQFCDTQRKGPFARWDHTHRFLPSAWPTNSELEDDVLYRLPGGGLGDALGHGFARSSLDRMFAFRHARTKTDLARHWNYHEKPRLRIVIAGASGAIGSQLAPYFLGAGHEVIRLIRRPEQNDWNGRAIDGCLERRWDPASDRLDSEILEGADAVINLCGHNVAAGRWSPAEKQRIIESRLRPTDLIARTLAAMPNPPAVLINASAVGYYGDSGLEELDESSPNGNGFLASVCRDWEAATQPAESAGIRVVLARIGLVLTPRGGVLAKLLPVFRAGLGGPIGTGRQIWPWIAMDDVLGALECAIHEQELSGPVNICAPAPVDANTLARVLARVLRRPSVVRVPPKLIELAFGEMGRETALKSVHAIPSRLRESGFTFIGPTLDEALRWELWIPRDP